MTRTSVLLLLIALFGFGLFGVTVGENFAGDSEVGDELDGDGEVGYDFNAGNEAGDDSDDDLDVEDNSDVVEPETTTAPPPVNSVPYIKPNVDEFLFAETFDGDVFSRWSKSGAEKFKGDWKVVTRQIEGIVGDVGLRVMDKALHHGIATKIPNKGLVANKGKETVVSYEAKFEEGLECGGGYLKLFHTKNLTDASDLHGFDNETPYVVMFGPDRCGATNKVHLIIKQQNPVSGEWVEHHLADAPRLPTPMGGDVSHVYTFRLMPNNTYEVLIDGGSLMSDFVPPFTPPMEIDDATDTKPDDWIDIENIADPDSVKPADWDETAPRRIPDESAEKPEDWLEHEQKLISDPSAKQPDSWNEDEDGPWEAPLIANPKCKAAIGCGPWTAPYIENPAYKGVWVPKMIPNPEYRGPWTPRQIANVNYFVNENPHAIADIDAVGFELWTMQKGLLFDNILISREMSPVTKFQDQSWKIRNRFEEASLQSKAKTPMSSPIKMGYAEKVITAVKLVASTYPLGLAVGFGSIVVFLVVMLLKVLKKPQPVVLSTTAETAAAADALKKATDVTPKKSSVKNSDDEKSEVDEAEETAEELKASEEKAAPRKRPVKKD